MIAVFKDTKGVLLIEYMAKNTTTNAEVYGEIIENLKINISFLGRAFLKTKKFAFV